MHRQKTSAPHRSRRFLAPLFLAFLASGPSGMAVAAGAAAAPASRTGPAMRLYRDPETGRIGAPPAKPPAAEALRAGQGVRPKALPDLTREPVRAAAGGTKVNLRGSVRAAVRRDGGAGSAMQCGEAATAADE